MELIYLQLTGQEALNLTKLWKTKGVEINSLLVNFKYEEYNSIREP
jgi:hypothetical protein